MTNLSHTRLSGRQIDHIHLRLAHVRSLGYVMARFGDGDIEDRGEDLLSLSQILDSLCDDIEATLAVTPEADDMAAALAAAPLFGIPPDMARDAGGQGEVHHG